MNHRDIWLVGLLALAYIYLDSSAPPARRTPTPSPSPPLPPLDEDPVGGLAGFGLPDACPRDLSHLVSLRADGAKWCRTCDEGFYPTAMVV